MNLSTARASTRAKEVGIRKVVGSNRTQLMGQFFAESLFFSLFSMVLAVVMAKVTLPFLNNLLDLNLSLSLSGAFSLILAGLVLCTGLLAGSYPALFLSRFQPVKVTRGRWDSGSRTPLLRRVLVVSQFTVSIFLIIGTMVIARQMDYIRKKDLGFNQEHILHLIFRGEFGRKYEAVKQELLNHPAIVSITASNCSFVGRSNGIGMGHWEGKTQEGKIPMALHAVDYDFFQTFDMKLVQGRFFSREFSTDEKKNFIFNEEAIRAMGMESPLGKQVTCRVGREIQSGKIIGVVRDYHFNSLHNETRPLVFVMAPWWYRDVFVKIKPGNIAATILFLKETIMRIVPDYHFEYKFLDAEIDRLYRAEDRVGALLRYGALMVVFIACLGLFGLAAFIVEQRTKEIGIRKVLGASTTGISVMLSQEFVKWVLLANIIAWPLAYYAAHSWLHDFYYRIGISLWMFVAAGLVAMVIAVLTVSFQAVKAARSNPVDSLRYE